MFNFCLKEGQKEQKYICGDTAGITDCFAKWQLFYLLYYILSAFFLSKQKEICPESKPL